MLKHPKIAVLAVLLRLSSAKLRLGSAKLRLSSGKLRMIITKLRLISDKLRLSSDKLRLISDVQVHYMVLMEGFLGKVFLVTMKEGRHLEFGIILLMHGLLQAFIQIVGIR
jgi:hypothetical protein